VIPQTPYLYALARAASWDMAEELRDGAPATPRPRSIFEPDGRAEPDRARGWREEAEEIGSEETPAHQGRPTSIERLSNARADPWAEPKTRPRAEPGGDSDGARLGRAADWTADLPVPEGSADSDQTRPPRSDDASNRRGPASGPSVVPRETVAATPHSHPDPMTDPRAEGEPLSIDGPGSSQPSDETNDPSTPETPPASDSNESQPAMLPEFVERDVRDTQPAIPAEVTAVPHQQPGGGGPGSQPVLAGGTAAEPTVVVEIDRVEVKLAPDPAPQPSTHQTRPSPGPSLDDYLADRSRLGGRPA
jgi:hypothetical protein